MLHKMLIFKRGIEATRKKNSERRLCYCIIAADQYMSLMLCYACPPSLNTVSLRPTVVDHCTIRYGTGRVVGTVSYTRTSTALTFHRLGAKLYSQPYSHGKRVYPVPRGINSNWN